MEYREHIMKNKRLKILTLTGHFECKKDIPKYGKIYSVYKYMEKKRAERK